MACEPLEARMLLAVDPVIAEFQAVNVSTLADEDGEWSDWIELQNPDTQSVSLDGWYLTDDPANLTKWRFPAVSLDSGQSLVVFASNKDRTDAAGELHTNFRLSATGEYLALVRPDGTSIVQAFDPYPAQFADQSYGLATGREITELIAAQAPVRTHVPTDDSLGLSWTQSSFDDRGWSAGTLAAGFEVLQPGATFREDFAAPLGPDWTVDRPDASQSTVNVAGGALVLDVPLGEDLGYNVRGTAPFVTHALPIESPADWEVITEVRQGAGDRGSAGIAVIDPTTGSAAIQFEYNARISFRLLSATNPIASKVSLSRDHYFLRLVRDGQTSSWSAYFKLNEGDDWSFVGQVFDADGAPMVDQPVPALYARTPSSKMRAEFEFMQVAVADQRPVYGPSIGTDLRDPMLGRNASVYLRVPFQVSGDPARFDELTLLTSFDDGFQAYLNGTPVASHNVPIDATWNSPASGTFGAVNGRIPNRVYALDSFTNLLQAGTNVLAIQGMNAVRNDPDFYFDATMSAAEVLSQTSQYFALATPGAANHNPAAPPPVIVGQQGAFFDSTTVELVLTEPNPQLEIRYTLDGSEPSSTSTLYTGPLQLAESAMLQARAFDTTPNSTVDPSPIVAGTFVALANELQGRTSDIPLVILDTLGQGIPGSSSTTLTAVNVLAVEVSKATGQAALSGGIVNYLGRGGIRDRGSSTAGQPKPNLSFETWGADGTTDTDDEDVALLGFASESDWVLHAPYNFDPALIRNQLAYGMANAIGRWAPGTRAIEVYLNRRDGVVAEDDYAGIYVLTEKIKQGPDRVDITPVSRDDNQEPEITGGYIWKIDREDPGEPSFSAGGANLNWVEPKSPGSRSAPESQRATEQQQAWVVDYFNKFRDASRNPDINDPEGYSKYIDVGSWVDHNLISVLGDNVDALNLSTYLFKDRGKKIEYGPQWDFDRSMESRDDRDNDPWKWGGSGGTAFLSSNYWSRLFSDPGFWQAYVDRWAELRRDVLSDESLNAMIDHYAAEVAQSQQRNFDRWPATRPRTSSAYNSGRLDGTWQGEVEHLRHWLLARAEFMDSNFAQPPTIFQADTLVPVGGTHVEAGTTVHLEGPLLSYFDDTEFISSEVGAVTARYFSPSDDTLGTDWAQPGFDDAAWASGPLGLGYDSGSDFTPYIQTEISPVEGGTTILLRIPFRVDSLDQVDDLVLRTRYDDGYVAYLNGVEILRRNLRDADLAWNSRASSRRDTDAVIFEDVDISEHKGLLSVGDNLLGIRLINSSATSNDIFVQPALVSRQVKFGIAPLGDVYYTTDGTDPRGPDGNPSPSALLAPRGHQLTIATNTRIIARNFDNVTDRGTESRVVRTNWSGPVEYYFVTQSPDLVISELSYNPRATEAEIQAGFGDDDFEFVEIYNKDGRTVNLDGVRLADGVEFDFFGSDVRSLAPSQYVLVVANQQAFAYRYGDGLPVAGEFTGNLSNAGEDVDLVDGVGSVLFSVNYRDNDLWGVAADGVGATLEYVVPPAFLLESQSKWYNWRSSLHPGGTPGRERDEGPGVVINEVLARTSQPVTLTDSIELLNLSNQSVDISGWYLTDDVTQPNKFPIPAGTILGPGQYVVFDERQFNATPPRPGVQNFALNGEQGESVWLVKLDGSGSVIEFIDDVHFGSTFNGESLGRLPNGTGRLAPLTRTTLGAANGVPRVGPLLISELQYNPTLSAAALAQDPSLEVSDLEFVEIHNPTAAAVDLTHWRLRGGINYDFVDGTSLAAGGAMVVLKFDPNDPENINQVNAFRAHYGIDAQVTLVGGYAGLLNNSDDRVTLLRPEIVQANPLELIHIAEDEVLYDDLPPWPMGADGRGSSLQRRLPSQLGNLGESWFAGLGTPGRVLLAVPGDFDGNGLVTANDIDLLNERLRLHDNDLAFDLDGDAAVAESDRDLLVQSILGTLYGDSNLDGRFNSSDLVTVFAEGQYEDDVDGNSGWIAGDWNGDGDFTTSDLVFVFGRGGYEQGRTATPAAGAIDLRTAAAAVDAIWAELLPDLGPRRGAEDAQ